MTRKFGIAVIGCGMAARPHARALQALADRIEVRGVYARTRAARGEFAERFGFPVAESAEALAADPRVDAALLLTPPNARLDLVRLFAANGKHILSEKPLERSVAAADRICGICRDNGVALGVVFQHRYRPTSIRLKHLIAGGALGAIRLVRVDVPWWRDQSYYDEPGRGTLARDGGGVLISQAIHTLDLMQSLAGPVSAVQALATTSGFHHMETEDFVAAGLTFASGAAGSLMATTAAYPGGAETIVLDCENASVTLKSATLSVVWHDREAEHFGAASGTGGGADPMDFPFEWHRDLIAGFVGALARGRPPEVSGDDALAVQKLIAALIQSSAQGRRVPLLAP